MPALDQNPQSPGELPSGTRIDGRYTVHGLLGRGAQAVVYDGTHDELARPVAIKVLDMSWAGESAAISRFLREARIASALSHSHIVDVSDLGRLQDGRPYLVMPKVPGVPLSEWLWTHGRQAALRVAQLLAGVASALDLIHARGFVHRDIKPENLMFVRQPDASETVVLLDFGIAVLTSSHAPRVTQRNVLFGTPAYMPPEMWEGSGPDARGDTYALATVAFELITGVLPFDDANAMQLLAKKYRTPAPRLSDMGFGEFSEALEGVFRHGLVRQPELRFGTAGAFVSALQRAAEGGMDSLGVDGSASANHRITLRMDARTPARQPLVRTGRRVQLRAVFSRTRFASQLVQRVVRRRARAHAAVRPARDATSGNALRGSRRVGIPLAALALVLLLPTRIDTTAVLPVMRAEVARAPAAESGGQLRHPVSIRAQPASAVHDAAAATGVAPRQQAPRAAPSLAEPHSTASRKPLHEAKDAVAAGGVRSPVTPGAASASGTAGVQQASTVGKPTPTRAQATNEPALVQQHIAHATTALLRGDTERAIARFQAALAMNRDSAPAWRGLGIAFERKQEAVKALAAYRRYLELATQGPQREAVLKRIRLLE
jgi:hypothetical protein